MFRSRYVLICFLIFRALSNGYELNGEFNTEIRNDTNSSYDIDITNDGDAETNDLSKKVWISQLFLEAQKKFDMNADVTENCKTDFELYKLYLRNLTVWAVKMLESSQWPSVGIYAGMTYHMGNFDECVMISKSTFSGKYCLVNAAYEIPFQNDIPLLSEFANENDSVWKALKQNLSWAMCVPDSCGQSDLENSLNRILEPLFLENGLNISIKVNPILCSTSKHDYYPSETYLYCAFIIISTTTLILCTVVDMKSSRNDKSLNEKKNLREQICGSLSVVRNFKNLIRVSSTDSPILYLIKILVTIGVIAGHRLIYLVSFPKYNSEYFEKVIFYNGTDFTLKKIFSARFIVKDCDGRILEGLVTGGWLEGGVFRCLYTNWYISTDIQLFVIGCILMMIYAKHEKLGLCCIAITLAGGIVTSFVVSYANYYHPVVPSYISTLTRPWSHKEVTEFYILPFLRLGPFLTGFVAAILTKKLQEKKIHFSDVRTNLFVSRWTSIFWKFVIMTYFPETLKLVNDETRLKNSIYAAVIRLMFVLPEALFLCIYFTSGPACDNVFVYYAIIGILTFYSDVVVSLIFAFFLHITVEAPITNLSKIAASIIFKKTNKVQSNGGANTVIPIEPIVFDTAAAR
ncbi:hypothetical protein PGB90_005020 [Kerria lacca]